MSNRSSIIDLAIDIGMMALLLKRSNPPVMPFAKGNKFIALYFSAKDQTLQPAPADHLSPMVADAMLHGEHDAVNRSGPGDCQGRTPRLHCATRFCAGADRLLAS